MVNRLNGVYTRKGISSSEMRSLGSWTNSVEVSSNFPLVEVKFKSEKEYSRVA